MVLLCVCGCDSEPGRESSHPFVHSLNCIATASVRTVSPLLLYPNTKCKTQKQPNRLCIMPGKCVQHEVGQKRDELKKNCEIEQGEKHKNVAQCPHLICYVASILANNLATKMQ